MPPVRRTNEEQILANQESRIRALERAPVPVVPPPLPGGSLGDVLSYGGSGWEAALPRLISWDSVFAENPPASTAPITLLSATIPGGSIALTGPFPYAGGAVLLDLIGYYGHYGAVARTITTEITFGTVGSGDELYWKATSPAIPPTGGGPYPFRAWRLAAKLASHANNAAQMVGVMSMSDVSAPISDPSGFYSYGSLAPDLFSGTFGAFAMGVLDLSVDQPLAISVSFDGNPVGIEASGTVRAVLIPSPLT